MLNWCSRFNICAFLDNHDYDSRYSQVECLAGAGSLARLEANDRYALQDFQRFVDAHADWCFGHLSYDLRDVIEERPDRHENSIGFPYAGLFVPEVVLYIREGHVHIGVCGTNDAQRIFQEILAEPASPKANTSGPSTPAPSENVPAPIDLRQRLTEDEYVRVINQLRDHIRRGDCYEINYCMEYYAESVEVDPLGVYHALQEVSPNPFSAFYRLDHRYLLCASPERYLSKQGQVLVSQPMKGTWKRDLQDAGQDELYREQLRHSRKDQSENVMVVDLVRNDLSRVCVEGSVEVEELFGVYTFPLVHQMISTVRGTLRPEMKIADIIEATFPMGSMTGAPKRRVMELIDRYETTARGLFSGAVGYISPEGNMDWNVVIRSLLYNAETRYLCGFAGSGVTWYSDPVQEYQECLLKVEAMKKACDRAHAFSCIPNR